MFSSNTSQVSDEKLYSEDVFSSFLYTGNGGSQTITNGIDLAGKGGLVWIKQRNGASYTHNLADTVRGNTKYLYTSATDAEETVTTRITSFGSSGYNLGANLSVNGSGNTYASWTFREAPKFFDVVTYTGNGSNRTISHNLGSIPGCIIVKRTDTTADWQVYHRSLSNTEYMVLNTTAAKATGTTRWNSTTPTSTDFTVGTDASVNANGGTYVAYLFAHDTTSDGIIQCGSFDQASSATPEEINLGWEPQWLLVKRSNSTSNWMIIDNMRGMVVDNGSGAGDMRLFPNLTNAESGDYIVDPTSTGFKFWGSTGDRWIYIAIRRGPMRTPTSGTSVFSPILSASQTQGAQNTTGFPIDLQISRPARSMAGEVNFWTDRLRGISTTTSSGPEYWMTSTGTNAEAATTSLTQGWSNTGFQTSAYYNSTPSSSFYNFRRAPSFFDVVCYSIPSAGSVNHNLGVVPEMMILKTRNASDNWYVYHSGAPGKLLRLNTTAAADTADYSSVWGSSAPTATQFSVGGWGTYFNYVWYGFASCPGVSKVGSYTGNGSSQTINCGFAAGARFVMIKRTDSTGDWYVWDSARGIVAGNDPHLSLNSTAAEVTTDDSVDTDSSGFVVNQLSATNINVSSATYIYLAVA